MIAIVYSGSRFADWRLASRGKVLTGFKTMGINPNLHDDRHIFQALNKSNSLINHAEEIKRIYFFGPGSSSEERKEKVHRVLSNFFKNARVFVDLDITASALAALGDNKGLVGILGSGSNACYYNGQKIFSENYGLGYILADEGSSNWIGRRLLKSFLTETMPEDLRDRFMEKHPLDRKQILEKVYNNPNPTLFLNSFSDFVDEHADHPHLSGIIQEGFDLFFKTYINPLRNKYPGLPLHFTGSVAATHEELLRKVARDNQAEIGEVINEPIHNLLNYYIKKS